MEKKPIITVSIVITATIILSILIINFNYLSTKNKERINACISTVGWRENSLKLVIKNILPQVDHIFVFLQFYDHIPYFLNNKKITVIQGENEPKAFLLGSSAKFFWADKLTGYYITIDDDILYPSDYVKYCINKINEYEKKAIVGFHGTIFKDKNKNNEMNRKLFHYENRLEKDTFVHMLGTGVMAYHTDTIRMSLQNFKTKCQDDLWFAVAAQKQKIPMICLARKENYINMIPEAALEKSSISAMNPTHQLKKAAEFNNWTLHKIN